MTDNEGTGYQVAPPTLSGAGQAAIAIGLDISALAGDVPSANLISHPGLDVAATLQAIVPLWQQHFTNVGTDVQNTGHTLCAISDNYSRTEDRIASSFGGLGV